MSTQRDMVPLGAHDLGGGDASEAANALGAAYERALSRPQQKAAGIVYTPAPLADGLVAAALDGVDAPTLRAWDVCDPACGSGAFLLAAARALHGTGVDAGEIVRARLWGTDTDPGAVAVAEASLALWAALHGAAGSGPGEHLAVADALVERSTRRFDLVIGNPPFLGQLRSITRHAGDRRAELVVRWGALVRPYTDAATLFLLAGREHLRPGGRMLLVQPLSMLAARDAGPVRDALLAGGRLRGLWVAPEPVFGASVQTCAPVIEAEAPCAGEHGGLGRTDVARWIGASATPAPRSAPVAAATLARSWAPLVLDLLGVPLVELLATGAAPGIAATVTGAAARVGDLARVTAGFRDEYYGLAPYVQEVPDDGCGDGRQWAPLVTCGLIHPGHHGWGMQAARFAGARWDRLGVDLAALRLGDPRLGRWVDARLRPKVLVATQTRIVEAVADRAGCLVPSVPVISVEPHDADDVARLVAALSAPPVSAWALSQAGGSGLSATALKLSARQVASLPLPSCQAAWDEATEAFAARDTARFAVAATAAYGLPADHPVVAWWQARVPATGSAAGTASRRPRL